MAVNNEGILEERGFLPHDFPVLGKYSIKHIKIPSGVTSIGDRAFNYCDNLTSIETPSSVTSIGVNAFSVCTSLTSIEIPSSVTSIGDGAFNDCTSLTSI